MERKMLTRSQNSNKALNEMLIDTLKSNKHERTKEIIIKRLLARGANINHSDCLGNTALHLARNSNEVSLLLRLGADANVRNFSGETPLLYILKKDRTVPVEARKRLFYTSRAIIRDFIRIAYRAHDLLNMNIKDLKGNSLLFEYVYKNECDINIIEQFISLGADVNIKSSSLNTLLHAAVSNPYCKINVVRYLLQKGLNPNAENSQRQTPLYFCLKMKDFKLDIVEELLKRGANAMKRDAKNNTPLYFAVMNVHCTEELLNLLLNGVESSLINERLGYGGTLLHKVVTFQNISVIEKLISCGANVNSTDSNGCTPLHLAVSLPYCDEKIVSLLVKHKADVNAKNSKNSTPLHKAFENTANMAIIKSLLHYKAKMCTLDDNACTPLHYLIRNSNFKISFLIELLSTEKSIDACLKLTANNKNFLYMCCTSLKINILKTVLKYLILKYHSRITAGRFPLIMDTFYSKLDRTNWSFYNEFYQACMAEINVMLHDRILDYINFYSVMVNEFSQLTLHRDNEAKKQIIDAVLVRMTNGQYPIYKDMVLYMKKQDFLKNLDDVRVSSVEYRDGYLRRITLAQFAVRHIAGYLSKQDVINLILAYSNVTDLLEIEEMSTDEENVKIEELSIDKENVKIEELSIDKENVKIEEMSIGEEYLKIPSNTNFDFTREVRVKISRLSQEDLKKLCKPCTIVIKNDVELKVHRAVGTKNEQHSNVSPS